MEYKIIHIDKGVYYRRAYSAAYYKKNKEHISMRNVQRVECPKCFKDLCKSSLSRHIKSQHNNNIKYNNKI